VVIYFSDEAKTKLNRGFYRSLKDNGVLFIGGTETLLDAQDLGFERMCTSYYQKNIRTMPQRAVAA
jgi:chemotaxis protein methyltransferase CheR